MSEFFQTLLHKHRERVGSSTITPGTSDLHFQPMEKTKESVKKNSETSPFKNEKMK